MSHKNDRSISISPFSAKDFRALQKHKRIDCLSITNQKVITAAIAKGFTTLQSVGHLFLWCSTTRTAMRHIISIPDLEELDILEIQYPGILENFSSACSLKIFRCHHCLSEDDLLEISKLPNLQELGAQYSAITPAALDGLLNISSLIHLNLEGTGFNDEMARMIKRSTRIKKLDLGATQLTSKGLQDVCQMPQLRSLDIWAINIVEKDLDLLSNLTKLEYLSIGGDDGQTVLTLKGVLPYLQKLPLLNKIWLDGLSVTENEEKILKKQYDCVTLTDV